MSIYDEPVNYLGMFPPKPSYADALADVLGPPPPVNRLIPGGTRIGVPIAPPEPPLILVNATGISGTTYSLQLHPIGTDYLWHPGVYIFCKLAPNGNWDAVYVGETAAFGHRLSRELFAHHKWPRIRAAGATHIATLHIPGPLWSRESIETDLRHSLNPPCNDQ
ncbi:MAG: hypothetical protein KDJ88_07850 [Bauldia sp.]|nr:hypothetical protein [Bauldia sp.]